jgi:tetratricopeptide (TPR) repeat protein
MSNGSGHAMVSPAAVPNTIPNGTVASPSNMIQKLAVANEQTWLLIGRVAEQMSDLEHALSAYENALRHNPMSMSGLTQVAGIARIKENYPKAVEYFQRVLAIEEENGEVWSALGHCYLMQDDLQKAYSAYQQALYLLPNPKARCSHCHVLKHSLTSTEGGSQALVWHRYPVRSLWVIGPRRRGVCVCPSHG